MRRFVSAAIAAGLLATIPAAATPVATLPPTPSGEALGILGRAPVRTSIAHQRIYFVFPDRYANGDPANDRGGRVGIRSVTGHDPADSGWFHGGDYRGLTDDCATPTRGLARIEALGFTAVWVTPPVKQKAVQGSSAAYHGYWGLDFTTVDPHLGTEADFGAFVGCAHRLGLKVYLDVVVNHTADVILPTGGTTWLGPDERPYRDCRGRVFEPARYARGRLFPCLTASRMPRPPLVFPAERSVKKPAWLNDVRRYHNRGEVSFDSCSELCLEQGDFFGLDDLFTEQPAVAQGLADLHAQWIRKYKVDGFRVDTARHVNRAFFEVWVPQVRAAARAAGVPDFEIFGEVFLSSAVDAAPFVRERGLPNVLDFPLQDAAVGFASGQVGARGIAARLEDDDYFLGPNGAAHTPPTFLGNHDMGRGAALIRARSGAGGSVLLRRVLLAHDLLYVLRGAPVVLYGDEVGIAGSGGDKAARQDLFPTQVPEWRAEPRVGGAPIGTGSSFDLVAHPVAERLKALGALRDAHPALATGAGVVRHAAGSVFAISRFEAQSRREYVAAVNAGTSAARITIRTATPGSSWTPLLGTATPSTNTAGDLVLNVPPLATVLLRAERLILVAKPVPPTLRPVADDLTELLRLDAVPGGSRTVSVSFAVKRARTGWRRVGADDSFPYRAFLDPRDYRRGEALHVVAIARSLDGALAVSPVRRVVPRPS
ncbi:MAG: alpha-amylase family glycosyl hydrolase [Gaiellaceae bacterium]